VNPEEDIPQRLRPDLFATAYVRPEGRTLQRPDLSAASKVRGWHGLTDWGAAPILQSLSVGRDSARNAGMESSFDARGRQPHAMQSRRVLAGHHGSGRSTLGTTSRPVTESRELRAKTREATLAGGLFVDCVLLSTCRPYRRRDHHRPEHPASARGYRPPWLRSSA
jgi:hypothetical protein